MKIEKPVLGRPFLGPAKIQDYQVVFQAKQAYMGQKDQDGYDAENVHFFIFGA